ncbi:MAG: hypothetical protein KAH25_08510 [Bacteroidales bacterium]|nr:hypothetical protein [Bacteroidales bacterium]
MKTKTYLFLLFLVLSITGYSIQPLYHLQASGTVTSFIVKGDVLYAATDAGCIDVFNWKTKKKMHTISFPDIKDFMGDDIPPKIYSIDIWADKIICVGQGVRGFRNVYLIEKEKKHLLIEAATDKMMIKKALFVNNDHILLATLGNELILYNILNKTIVYNHQLGTSVFSDIDLNNDKTKVATADESGIIHIINVENGKTIEELKGQNLDNIYQTKFNNNWVIGAGQDRRASVYQLDKQQGYYLESSFIIYCVGLDQQGEFGAFSYSEENYIKVFNTKTKEEIALLKGQKSTLTQIEFVAENTIISSSEDTAIMVWKWK